MSKTANQTLASKTQPNWTEHKFGVTAWLVGPSFVAYDIGCVISPFLSYINSAIFSSDYLAYEDH